MHKKSRLEERMAACGDLVKMADLTDKNMQRASLTPEYVPFNDVFSNANPLYLEIGCGKGKFVCEMAKKFPNVNFIACEKISNVLIEALERVKDEGLKNVYFLNCAAEVLAKYIEQGAIERIYLNFSNPLPKEGYKKQRLTHPRFLNIYRGLLKRGGLILQKTDDEDFYRFSLDGFKEAGFEVISVCEDYRAPDGDDAETEHERRFKDMGKRIFRVMVRV